MKFSSQGGRKHETRTENPSKWLLRGAQNVLGWERREQFTYAISMKSRAFALLILINKNSSIVSRKIPNKLKLVKVIIGSTKVPLTEYVVER